MWSNPTALTYREHGRHLTSKTCSIIFNNGRRVLSCTMHNYSTFGALLKLRDSVHTSKEFELLLLNENKIVNCDVVWRKGNLVGVAFSSSWKTNNPNIKSGSISELVIEKFISQLSA